MRLIVATVVMVAFLYSCTETGSSTSSTVETTPETNDVVDEVIDSLKIYNDIIVNNPSQSSGYHNRAKYHVATGNLEAAMNDVDRAIKIDSLESPFHVTRGNVFLRQGNIALAKTNYDRAIKIDKNNRAAHIAFSKYYMALTNYDKALSHADDALRLDVNDPKTYFLKGRIFLGSADTARAKSSFRTAAEMKPDYFEPYYLLGVISADEGDPLAEQYYNSALEVKPGNPEALYGLGYYYMNQDNKDGAFEIFRKLQGIEARDPIVNFNLGYLHMFNSELDSAIHYYGLAIDNSQDYFQAYYNRGLCKEEKGQFEEARMDYQAAIDLKPDYQVAIEAINKLDS